MPVLSLRNERGKREARIRSSTIEVVVEQAQNASHKKDRRDNAQLPPYLVLKTMKKKTMVRLTMMIMYMQSITHQIMRVRSITMQKIWV